MSKITIALEAAVAAVRADTVVDGEPTRRQRANIDKAFVAILRLIAPRIRHFIRQYGLVGHWEDAEQCCAIAVHRAILGYDPEKAQFTTFVNWQIRGELQGLRFRLMTDQRPSAKKVAATTVSLNAVTSGSEGEENTLESMIVDEHALSRTESAASDFLANSATTSLIDAFIDDVRTTSLEQLRRAPRAKRVPGTVPTSRAAPALRRSPTHGIDPLDLEKLDEVLVRDRQIIERRLTEAEPSDALEVCASVTKERARQITKRATKTIAELAKTRPQFVVMAEYHGMNGTTRSQVTREVVSSRQQPGRSFSPSMLEIDAVTRDDGATCH